MVTRVTMSLVKNLSTGLDRLFRSEFLIYPTQITDRHGNTVTFEFDPVNQFQLKRIVASDGRIITLTYQTGTTRVATVSDGARTWSYSYDSTAASASLTTLTQPDGQAWRFNVRPLWDEVTYLTDPNCTFGGDGYANARTGTMVHPSGAQGSFTVTGTQHGRKIDTTCYNNQINFRPRLFATRSLTSKTLSGPGMPPSTWTYSYPPAVGGDSTCTSCPNAKVITARDPRGHYTRYTYGIRDQVNEGQLLLLEEGMVSADGAPARTTNYTYKHQSSGPWPSPLGYSVNPRTDALNSVYHNPLDRSEVTQQGVTFTRHSNSFDVHARPLSVTRSSSLGTSRTDTTAYHDNLGKWVLGQVASVTEASTGAVVESNTYHPTTALRTERREFGLLRESFAYHADGTLYIRYDQAGRPSYHTNYKRGLPQNVSYPDGSSESAVVDNLGLITSHTNPAGTTTVYSYDAMGRLASIDPPDEPGLVYNNTTQLFEKVNAVEYGLGAGHWRQTVSTGTARTYRYFDALWRPVVTQTVDLNNSAGTSKIVQTRWDIDGRKTFESYPQPWIPAFDSALPGNAWSFDALGREFKHFQDSELGLLTTTTDYLAGFQKRVTNPRGHATTYGYQAFDQPAEDAIAWIQAPEGVSVSIPRDVFGKARSITRSGSYGGVAVSATRSYVYDAHQRLCKTVEPETGATIQLYDAAGNIGWRASGLALTGTTTCDHASVPATSRVNHNYDARNRLWDTTYGDGSPAISRRYTPDGLLQTISSGGGTWTYGYNNRRLLTREVFGLPGYIGADTFTWGIDSNGADLPHRPDGQLPAQRPGRADAGVRLRQRGEPPPQRRHRRLHAGQRRGAQPVAERPRPALGVARRRRAAVRLQLRPPRQRRQHHRSAAGRGHPQHGLRRAGSADRRQRPLGRRQLRLRRAGQPALERGRRAHAHRHDRPRHQPPDGLERQPEPGPGLRPQRQHHRARVAGFCVRHRQPHAASHRQGQLPV
jgi:YD repeat-containing protein